MTNKPSANRHSRRLYRGDRVLVAKDLGGSMRHFSGAGKPAIVLGSYGDLCHGDDHGSYSLLFEGGSESWYRREQLTKKGRRATEEEIEAQMLHDRRREEIK